MTWPLWVPGPRGQRQDGILRNCQQEKYKRINVFDFHQDPGPAAAAASAGESNTLENSNHIDCVSGRLWGRIPPQGQNPLEGWPAPDRSAANGDGTDDEDVAYATRRLGSALEGVLVAHLHVGWGMALLCLNSALPRLLVCASLSGSWS